MRLLLLPFSFLYGAGVVLRNLFFEIGILRTQSVGVPVIAVGNISAGGVGKTPFVELLVRKFTAKGKKVAVVSRGYGRATTGTVVVSDGSVLAADSSAAGDEAFQIAAKLSGTIVIVDEQRVRGARCAVERFGASLIVLDDAFQHRYIKRDVDIVLMPAADAHNPGMLLPAGNRREPLRSLSRASLIALTRCEGAAQYESACGDLRRFTQTPVIGLTTRVTAFRRASTRFSVDLPGLKGKSAVAFSGIGNPESFEGTLHSLGLTIVNHLRFPDHHVFTKSDLRELEEQLSRSKTDFLVTTEKDIARLERKTEPYTSFLDRAPLYYIEIEQAILKGEQVLNSLIEKF
ncbi:MAG TPA: tetraacyldisaccharide 4'-kinase [Bacteroidota bacterium]|nr:tetraacyldisaccharide 4'-kinase [Bacteroidota bacterium]